MITIPTKIKMNFSSTQILLTQGSMDPKGTGEAQYPLCIHSSKRLLLSIMNILTLYCTEEEKNVSKEMYKLVKSNNEKAARTYLIVSLQLIVMKLLALLYRQNDI